LAGPHQCYVDIGIRGLSDPRLCMPHLRSFASVLRRRLSGILSSGARHTFEWGPVGDILPPDRTASLANVPDPNALE